MEFVDIARYLGALILVLALVGLAGLGVRRFGVPGVMKGGTARRLAVVETLMIGPRQRLFLVRRDGVEHLVMANGEALSVIESGIPAATSSPVGFVAASQT